jgi:hypothetical protein
MTSVEIGAESILPDRIHVARLQGSDVPADPEEKRETPAGAAGPAAEPGPAGRTESPGGEPQNSSRAQEE